MTMSKGLIAGAVAAAALAIGGGAVAATQLGSKADEQAILEDAAGRLGVEPAELSAALEEAFAARIDAAVAAGRLTQEQADRLKERLEAGGLPLFGGGPGPHGHGFFHGGLEAAAAYLGLTEAELREALHGGQTLAEIAAEEGKTVEGLKDAMVAEATEQLDAAVADGRLTEDLKQQLLEDLPKRIDALIQGELPPLPRDPGGGSDGPEDAGLAVFA
jgi:uncharacterized protein YidB (DUF937 family)